MLTTTVFLDFGQGLAAAGLDMTVAELRDINGVGPEADRTTGPDLANKPDGTPIYTGSDSLHLEAIGVDLNDDGSVNAADLDLLANRVLDIARQAFEPFNVDVQLAAAGSTADVVASLAANGDGVGNRDAYVLATSFTSGGDNVGQMLGLLGRAATVDLGENAAADGVVAENATDEVAVAFANHVLMRYDDPNEFVQALAFVSIHEASHTLGLRHTRDATPAEGLLSTGDMMRLGSDTRDATNIFTRFDLDLSNSPLLVNNYEELVGDENIGYRDDNANLVPDLAYVTGTGAHDHIRIVDNGGGSVLVTVDAYADAAMTDLIRSESYRLTLDRTDALGTEGRVVVDASFGDDLIEIVVNHNDNADFEFDVRGGAGANRLIGEFRGTNTWTIDGADSGNLNGRLRFFDVGDLSAGTRNRQDVFVLASGGSLSGGIDGGRGADTLDLSALSAPTITPQGPGAIDGLNGLATGLGDGFQNINAVVGDGTQVLIGPDAPAEWQIDGNHVRLTFAGDSFEFDNVAAIHAGNAADRFSVVGSAPSPQLTIDGGDGDDALLVDVAADQTWTLSGPGAGDVNGVVFFQSLEDLAGAAMTSNDTFVFLPGGSVPGDIDGGSGEDTLDFSAADSQVVALSALGAVDGFNGTAAAAIGGEFRNINALIGSTAGTTDALVGLDQDTDWSITALGEAMTTGGRTLVLGGIDGLIGGEQADRYTISVAPPAGLIFIDGRDGADTLLADIDANQTWTLDGPGRGDVNGAIEFAGIDFLTGAAMTSNDTFVFLPGSFLAGDIDGGSGEDTLDFSAVDSQVLALTGGGAVDGLDGFGSTHLGGAFHNIDALVGSSSGLSDMLAGLDEATEWLLEGDNGSVRTLGKAMSITGFESLVGGSQADHFSFGGTPPVADMSIAGGGGENSVALDLGESAQWTFDGAGAGRLALAATQVEFAEMIHVAGDASADDLFIFDGLGSLIGNLDGRGGDDTLNVALAPAQTIELVDVGAIDGFDGTAMPAIGEMFHNINRIVADATPAHSLRGLNAPTNWRIEGGAILMSAAGRELQIANVQTLFGGSDSDDFQVLAAPSAPLALDGGDGTDSLLVDIVPTQKWTIDSVGGGNVNEMVVFSAMENLAGAAMTSDDTFVFLPGGAVPGNVDGGSGDDTLDFSATDSVLVHVLNNGVVDGADGVASPHIGGLFLNIEEIVGSEAGLTDELVGRDLNSTWLMTGDRGEYIDAGLITLRFGNFDSFVAGTGDDYFAQTFTAPTNPITINGGDGNDELAVSFSHDHLWTIDGPNSGNVDNLIHFVDVENLAGTGLTANDTFAVLIGGSLSGSINGHIGRDTLDLSALDTPQVVQLSDIGGVDGFDGITMTGPIGGGFQNIDAVVAGSTAEDMLTGVNRLSDWVIDGDAGALSAFGHHLDFASFEIIRGGDAKDRFAIMNTVDGAMLEIFGALGHDEFMILSTGLGSTLSISGAYGSEVFEVLGTGEGSTLDLRGNDGRDDFRIHGAGLASEIRTTGGQGHDSFLVTASAAGSILKLFGNTGDDRFQIGGDDAQPNPANLDSIEGSVIVRAAQGDDAILVNDQASGLPATYSITPTSVTTENADGSPRAFGGLIYDGDTEQLDLAGSELANLFLVVPSELTRHQLFGNDPTGDPVHGDELRIDFAGTTGRRLTLDDRAAGDGRWEFANRRDVEFRSIEHFNY
ncbi:MAG: hypothetical protein KDA42_10890, partial [Planctomycetales bacterium]|nr:hypothetical protein [Planctomycetales bacterium]